MPQAINRRSLLKKGSAALLAAALPHRSLLARIVAPFDVVIRNGTVVDGTGAAPFRADLGIVGDRIEALGKIAPDQGSTVIDAAGLHVSPGFIDIHTHSDSTILRCPTAPSRIHQGVTTEVTGNCGGSAAPRKTRDGGVLTVAAYGERVDKASIALNQALLLGQGTIRRGVVGLEDRRAKRTEMDLMLRTVQEGMDQGAFGLSTGLEYTPGLFTPREEITALARVVARRDGLYASHIRNEEAQLLEAIHEAILIGRESGARVQISHLKAAGRPNWSKQTAALHLIEGARRQGLDVLADAYPYAAYSTSLTILLPKWAQEGGSREILKRLGDPDSRARIRKEVASQVEDDPGGFDLIVISRVRTKRNAGVVGRSLEKIAADWHTEPVEGLLRLLEEENASVGFIGHGMSEANVAKVLAHPLVMVGSDGSSMAPPTGPVASRPHPRSYGTFPRVLGRYSRKQGIMDLATAIRKMTSMPADQVGISGRGRIARTFKADLVVFDAASVIDVATYDDPHRFPVGIRHVFVNGKRVIAEGKHTDARPGGMLRKS